MFGFRGRPQHGKFPSQRRAEPSPARKITILLVLSALVMGACGPRSKTVPKHPTLGWRPVASWSGRGNTQTESFNMESGQWRIRWETSERQPSGAGTFRVIVHSSVSGRLVEVAVEHQGAGSGLAYVAEDPRQFFLEIESSGVDWKVAVEEGVIGEE
jgi:hypothetical protein